VAEVERTLEAADKYGHAGVSQMESWNAAIKHEGPNVATKAGLFYATLLDPLPKSKRSETKMTLPYQLVRPSDRRAESRLQSSVRRLLTVFADLLRSMGGICR
jgi:hypothetical protein